MARKLFKQSSNRKIKLIILGLFVLSGIIVFSFVKMFWRKNNVDGEINVLETKIDDLEDKNTELSRLIDYLNSPEFINQEGKAKLGLRTTNEKVVVVDAGNLNLNNSAGYVKVGDSHPSNLEKWWEYFTK